MMKIMLVDDHTLFREGLAEIINKEPDMTCVAAVANGQDAIERVKELEPHIMVIDIAMPGMNGIEVAKMVKAVRPETGILILTAYPYGHYVRACISVGVEGFLLKTTRRQELVSALRMIYAGEGVFDVSATKRVLQSISNQNKGDFGEGVLYGRELEVLGRAAKGMSNKKIAVELGISGHTVATHFINIFRKMEVATRTEAVIKAFKAGLLETD